MPRYFFHFGDSEAGLDPIGMELADDNEARIQAARTLGEMLKDQAGEFWSDGEMRVTVTDETGLILFVLELSAYSHRRPVSSVQVRHGPDCGRSHRER